MVSVSIELDEEGDVLLWRREESPFVISVDHLGKPREELYEVVPSELWPRLEEMIAARRDSERCGRDYRAEIVEAYYRGKL